MSSIIKVDTIQDQTGNNIINENSNTITIGKSGDTINIVGTLQNNGSALPGDISSVVAGTGLSGGGSSGNVTLNIEAAQPTITSLGTLTGLTTTGNINLGDNDKVIFGAGSDLEIYHSGTQSIISDVGSGNLNLEGDAKIVLRNTGGTENYAQFFKDGAVELYHNNTKKIETTASGAAVAGDVQVDNGASLGFGGSNYKIEGSSSANHRIAFHTDGSERARFDASGDLGIGTSSPNLNSFNKALTLSGTNNAGYELAKGSTLHGALALQGDNRVQLINFQNADLTFNTGTSATERMRVVHSTGNVGIGTSSPRAKLDLGSGSGDSSTISTTPSDYQLILEAPQGTGDYGRNIGWSVGTNGVFASINAVDTGTSDKTGLAFITGDNSGVAEAVRISHDGKIGIGTTSPSTKLDVAGDATITKSDTPLYLNRTSSDGEIVRFSKDGTSNGQIATFSGKMYIGTGNANFRFRDDLNAIIPANANGSNSDNDLDLGYSTVRWRRLYLSEGVFLGGTGTANKLDDYEEGTWTPTLSSGTCNVSTATYTKIGNQCTIAFSLNNFSDTSTTTDVIITGLPFTQPSNTETAVGSAYGERTNVNKPTVELNSNNLRFRNGFGSSTFDTPLKYSDINDGADLEIRASVTYQTS